MTDEDMRVLIDHASDLEARVTKLQDRAKRAEDLADMRAFAASTLLKRQETEITELKARVANLEKASGEMAARTRNMVTF